MTREIKNMKTTKSDQSNGSSSSPLTKFQRPLPVNRRTALKSLGAIGASLCVPVSVYSELRGREAGGNDTEHKNRKLTSVDSQISTAQVGGIVAVLVTPYAKDGAVDPVQMELLARNVAHAGVNGLFVAGSTGDMPLLEMAERETLFHAAKKGAGKSVILYGGVTSFSVSGTIENCKRAAAVGVDVAVVMPPLFFFKYSVAEITAYMKQIADGSPIPVLMYHHQMAPTPIELETIEALIEYPNILGMKETGKSIDRTYEILKLKKGKRFLLLQGNEGYVPESLTAGVDGMMGALPGVYPEVYVEMYKAHREKDAAAFKRSVEMADALCNVFSLMPRGESFSYFGYTLKRLLVLRGWQTNAYSRLPGFVPNPELDKRLAEFSERFPFHNPSIQKELK